MNREKYFISEIKQQKLKQNVTSTELVEHFITNDCNFDGNLKIQILKNIQNPLTL